MSAPVRDRLRSDDTTNATPRGELAPRRNLGRLPSSRAVVGGLLIALSAGGVFVAHRGADTAPDTRYLVVTEPVQEGTVLTERHLGQVAVELPDGLNAVAAEEVEGVLGRVARTQLEPLDLLRSADLYETDRFTTPGSIEVALDLPPARALDGVLRVGSVVDVLGTDPSGAGTTTIASGVSVVGAGTDSGDEIGARGTTRVRLSLPDTETAERLVDAAVRAEVTLTMPAPGSRDASTEGGGT